MIAEIHAVLLVRLAVANAVDADGQYSPQSAGDANLAGEINQHDFVPVLRACAGMLATKADASEKRIIRRTGAAGTR
jgi:hypothetical protein